MCTYVHSLSVPKDLNSPQSHLNVIYFCCIMALYSIGCMLYYLLVQRLNRYAFGLHYPITTHLFFFLSIFYDIYT